MDLQLSGRTAVVTGAGAGIGLATSRALVGEGVHVVAGSLRVTEGLKLLADAGTVTAVALDLTAPGAPGALLEAAEGRPVDILVNNVGAAHPRPAGFESVTDLMWHDSLEINLMAAVRMTRAVLPGMVERGRGLIANTGSVNARLPDPLVVDYSAAKGALVNMAKALSKEVGPKGIRVVTVDPGPVATALWLGDGGVASVVAGATGRSPDEIAQGAAADMLTGRFSSPEEVANLLVMLASDRVANLTGADVVIDGGMLSTL
jgi:NAD(P)-dependent dehydrogenase (short-subunit alcohol dehydrogenase family)